MRHGCIWHEAQGVAAGGSAGELDWNELVAHVCACTGWTWDYVLENVDIPRLESLKQYWQDHPPVQWMMASYFGIKPANKTNNKEDIEQLMSMFGVKK